MPRVERSLADPDFRNKMIEDPDTIFREAGIEFGDGVSVKVVEETTETRFLVLPPPVEAIPAKRMNLFNSMLTSGSLLGAWGQDDNDYADPTSVDPPGFPSDSDPATDDWSPF